MQIYFTCLPGGIVACLLASFWRIFSGGWAETKTGGGGGGGGGGKNSPQGSQT